MTLPTKPLLLLAAALGAAVIVWWAWPEASPQEGGAPAAVTGVQAASGPARWSASEAESAGLRFDAARVFELSYAGGLVVDQNTRAALEAVMGAMPENPSDEDLAKIDKALREGMPREEAARAMKLVRGYRDYVGDVKRQMTPMGIPGNLKEANAFFDNMDAIRARHFDAETARTVFGPYDGYARITMEASFVAQDATLSFAEKKAQLDALRARLPEDQRSLIAEPAEEAGASASAPMAPAASAAS